MSENTLFLIEMGSNNNYFLSWSEDPREGNLALGEYENGVFTSYSGKSLKEIEFDYEELRRIEYEHSEWLEEMQSQL
jgi:hypothetical protein